MRTTRSPMRSRRARGILVILALAPALLVVATPPAAADHAPGAELIFEDCPGPDPLGCSYDEDGHVFEGGSDITGARAEGFGGLLFLALLWSLVPAGIAGGMASSRNANVGLAVVVALAFGWLGLAGLWFYWQDKGLKPKGLGPPITEFPPRDRPAARPASRDAPAHVVQGARTASERLKELTSLLDQGLIDGSEYDSRRQAILNEV